MRIFKHNQPQNYIKILDYTYTSQPSINNALPLQFSKLRFIIYIILCIVSLGFVYLLARWSYKRKSILLYSVCDINQATAFLIVQQDNIDGSAIVQRQNKLDIKRRTMVVSFCFHDRNFLYHQEKDVFLPIRYQDIGLQLDKLKKSKYQPSSQRTRNKLIQYYGLNQIQLNVQNYLQVFIQEMLTPYQVFQLYAILLWIYQEYYIFALILLFYSFYTYWEYSRDVVENQKILKQKSYFYSNCKVLIKNRQFINNKNMMKKQQIIYDNDNDSQGYSIIDQQIINQQKIHKIKQFNLSQEIPYQNNKLFSTTTGNSKYEQQNIINNINVKQNSNSMNKFKQNNNINNINNNANNVNSNINNKSNDNIKQTLTIQQIQLKNIIPGDIIILKQGQIVPCDCILLTGQAIVDQSYTNGENYLIRKQQIQNYQYSKDREKGFLLYLGTKLVKINIYKNYKKQISNQQIPFCLNLSLAPTSLSSLSINNSNINNNIITFKNLLQPKQIACLVLQTNYNTQRGKYLRQIRYQKKAKDNFTRQTIYFIYIIFIITVIVFLALLPILYQGQSNKIMFIMFLDLLATSIPITLPTALSVGINFAQHRLFKSGIHSILPSNIIIGGRATTIVIDSNKVLGRNYQVSSIVVGIKGNKSIGNTYSSLSQFLDMTNKVQLSDSYYIDPQKKKKQIKNMQENGKMLLRAFSTCHSLERYNNQLSGTVEEKNLFQFSEGKYVDQNIYQCLGENIKIQQRIYFKQKDKKLAVVVQINNNNKYKMLTQPILQQVDSQIMQQKQKQSNKLLNSTQIKQQKQKIQRIIFIKGPAQKIIKLCKQETYPIDYHDYIVDIAQKGFKCLCYAYKKVPQQIQSIKTIQYLKQQFIFCGFALLQAQKQQDTIQTIKQLKQSKMQLLLISSQRQLQTNSIVTNNKLYTKNQLILCSMHHGKIKCTGHLQWESSGNQNNSIINSNNNNGDDVQQFLLQSDSLFKNTYLSLNSKLYQQLFMRRDDINTQHIFKKTVIFNQMQNRHSRNVYFQLQKREKITFAIGSGQSVSQCANLSMQLQRGQCSMLSSFHTNQRTIKCITKCLIICRAALATNFHCFSMMILFALVQFTTVVNLNFRYQNMTDLQYLYQDLFVTFPIFVTINLTSPVDKLSKQLPPKSFFSTRSLASMIGQFTIQLITQSIFINYLSNLQIFHQDIQKSHVFYVQNKQFSSTPITLATFILTNYLYLGIVLSTSVSKPFRKPFYTNPYYTCTLVLLWFYNTAIVLLPQIVPNSMRIPNLSQTVQQILMMSMLLGNLIMIVMYMYENLLVWVLGIYGRCRANATTEVQMYMM